LKSLPDYGRSLSKPHHTGGWHGCGWITSATHGWLQVQLRRGEARLEDHRGLGWTRVGSLGANKNHVQYFFSLIFKIHRSQLTPIRSHSSQWWRTEKFLGTTKLIM
jgi:hypothetical protein